MRVNTQRLQQKGWKVGQTPIPFKKSVNDTGKAVKALQI